jgi:phosphoribosylamine---glycine ligase
VQKTFIKSRSNRLKILIIGSGGREHALTWKLAQGENELYCAPGNGGIVDLAKCINVNPEDIPALLKLANELKVDLVVVGPEAPLVLGIADEFQKHRIPIFAPKKEAARLEGEKIFAKELMRKYNIPTAQFEIFHDEKKAKNYIEAKGTPIVIKASGLAAGKGAMVCQTKEDAFNAIERSLVQREFGTAGETIVIEKFLTGEEASIIAITDGKTIKPLISSQDHKALLDGDKGPNTGGLGAYAPAPLINEKLEKEIQFKIFNPLLAAFQKEGIEYSGVIYAGIIITAQGPFVLEFNCRFGDPETQPILTLLKSDLAQLMLSTINGKLADVELEWKKNYALCVVAASAGYPGKYEKGKEITGDLQNRDDVIIFHAGTERRNGKLYTAGGRVLGVTGIGTSLSQAKAKAYQALKQINFAGIYYRTDIGDKGIRRLEKK